MAGIPPTTPQQCEPPTHESRTRSTQGQQDSLDHAESPRRKRQRLDDDVVRTSVTPPNRAAQDTDGDSAFSDGSPGNRCSASNRITLDFREPHSMPEELPCRASAANAVSSSRAASVQAAQVAADDLNTLCAESASSPVIELVEGDESDATLDGNVRGIDLMDGAEVVAEIMNTFPLAEHRGLLPALREAVRAVSDDTMEIRWYTEIAEWMQNWTQDTRSFSEERKLAFESNPEFWTEMAQLFYKLTQKRSCHGLGNKKRIEFMLRLLTAYFELCDHLLIYDAEAIELWSRDPVAPLQLISEKHLRNLEILLRQWNIVPLWRAYSATTGVQVARLQNRLVLTTAVNDFDPLVNLVNLTQTLAAETGSWKHCSQCLVTCLRLLRHYDIILSDRSSSTEGSPDAFNYASFAEGLSKVSATLEQVLFTNTTATTATIPFEHCVEICSHAGYLLHCLAMTDSVTIRRFLCVDIDPFAATLERFDLMRLVVDGFRLKLLWQMMLKGRMELRVSSVDYMSRTFVVLWKDYQNQLSPDVHPVLQVMAKWIIDHELVDKLSGADSHPQLLSRCTSIFGFLFVTKTWTGDMTERYWFRVNTVQDQRLVSAALEAIKGDVEYMDTATVLQFCDKMEQVPPSALTREMYAFLHALIGGLMASQETWVELASLCHRMLQRAFDREAESTITTELQELVKATLGKLSRELLPVRDRQMFYLRCLQDIRDKSSGACGSVLTIAYLASAQAPEETIGLVDEMDLLRSLAELIVFDVGTFSHTNTARSRLCSFLNLLGLIYRKAPRAIIDQTLRESLWQHLVGPSASDRTSRDLCWDHLRTALSNQGNVQNAMLNELIDNFIPSLPMQYCTQGLFNFIAGAVNYLQRRVSQITALPEEEVITPPLHEVIWHLVLEAPDQSIEIECTSLLSRIYVTAPWILEAPSTIIGATHTMLVERCLHQLEAAAQDLRRARTADVGNEHANIQAPRRRFFRTVNFLRKFLDDVRGQPGLKDQSTEVKLPSPVMREAGMSENAVLLKYQTFTPGKQGGIKDLEISEETTFAKLSDLLKRETGFERLNVVHGGKIIDLGSTPDYPATSLAGTGLLLVRNIGGSTGTTTHAALGATAAERAVSSHLDVLIGFLDIDEDLSAPVFTFVVTFPPHNKIREMVLAGQSGQAKLFPRGKRFHVLYSFGALQRHLAAQLSVGNADESFLLNGVRALTDVLTGDQFADISTRDTQEYGCHLADALVHFLKERPTQEVSNYFGNEELIEKRLFGMLERVLTTPDSMLAQHAFSIFSTLIEAALHGKQVWEYFRQERLQSEVHLWLLTSTHAEQVANLIESVTSNSLSTSAITLSGAGEFYWQMFSELVLRLPKGVQDCKHILKTAIHLFGTYSAAMADEATLRQYLSAWTALLSEHTHSEVADQAQVDEVVLGLVSLISIGITFLKAFVKPLPAQGLAELLLDKYLFPGSPDDARTPKLPILDSATRKQMYQVLLTLCEHASTYRFVLQRVTEITNTDAGVSLQEWGLNRTGWLRTSAGYGGLRNLTNTCYMNSLMTQLFMNVEFREYMLSATAETKAQYNILPQLQELFARMQSAMLKFTDTRELAYAVQPYDAEHIDVTIQMDVDEFYNLLFDRIENAMATPDAKQKFRSFYGGELVSQVKSMDCEHISERVEPFLAIQCDVKDKTDLQASLQSYVVGDVMEGDNKYKCESCGGRFVNAVKRSCLKNLPDNLIFHLKRFDFDLSALQRNKINDYFAFPEHINMTPYTVEYLAGGDEPPQEDVFQLVGVLVHSGTAETGHYYSYIRLSNVKEDGKPKWAEFNDTEVTDFDPTRIGEQCFGGVWNDPDTNMRFPKINSAYMLFYQRLSKSQQIRRASIESARGLALQSTMPSHMTATIAEENHSLLRRYTLFDPVHAHFARNLLNILKNFNSGVCSERHEIENRVLSTTIQYTVSVAARVKSAPDVEALTTAIRKFASGCNDCTHWVLHHLADKPTLTTDMLLLCPISKARQAWADMLLGMLRDLRRLEPEAYSPELSEHNLSELPFIAYTREGAFERIMNLLYDVIPHVGRHPRIWEELFGLLASMAALGKPEIKIMLHKGIWRDCLDLLMYERPVPLTLEGRHIDNRTALKRLKKLPAFMMVVKLIYHFLFHLDVYGDPVHHRNDQILEYNARGQRYPLLEDEQAVLRVYYTGGKGRICLVSQITERVEQRALEGEPWWPGEIISLLLDAAPSAEYIKDIATTIAADISEFLPGYVESGLRTALSFCRKCPEYEDAIEIVNAAAGNAREIIKHVELRRGSMGIITEPDVQGGQAHLDFFATLAGMQSVACSSESGVMTYPFLLVVLHNLHIWAPPILIFDDVVTRDRACELLDQLVFNHYPFELNTEIEEQYALAKTRSEIVRRLFDRCVHHLELGSRKSVPRSWAKHTLAVMQECVKWTDKLLQEQSEEYSELFDSGDEGMKNRYLYQLAATEKWRDEDDWSINMISDEDMDLSDNMTEDLVVD